MFQKVRDLKSEPNRLGHGKSTGTTSATASGTPVGADEYSERIVTGITGAQRNNHNHLYQRGNYVIGQTRREDKQSQPRARNSYSHSSHQHSQVAGSATTTSTSATTKSVEMQAPSSHRKGTDSGSSDQRFSDAYNHPTRFASTNSQQHQHQNHPITSNPHPKLTSTSSPASVSRYSLSASSSNASSESNTMAIAGRTSGNPQKTSSHSAMNPPTTSISQLNNDLSPYNGQGSPRQQPTVHNNTPVRQLSDRELENLTTTVIEEELENELAGLRESEMETLRSLEQTLPVELSFLIRQQAYCLARMNYLDRQIRELKEARQQATASAHQVHTPTGKCSANGTNQSQVNRLVTATSSHNKNGNFIPSDDSGGEYSRATISDDDELSSLLDQIAKSVRPERGHIGASVVGGGIGAGLNQANMSISQHLANRYSIVSHQPQSYAMINPGQLQHHHHLAQHHQAMPVFVMSSPIAVAHPAPSISSTVLPGVHFQPEPRYNQYYEDFYVQAAGGSMNVNNHPGGNNNTGSNGSNVSVLHRHNNLTGSNALRSQQFDSSISAIEQLVSQREKRQIKSQLKSADNWLRMRSSGMSNLAGNSGNNGNSCNNGKSVSNSNHITNVINTSNANNSSSSDNSNLSNSNNASPNGAASANGNAGQTNVVHKRNGSVGDSGGLVANDANRTRTGKVPSATAALENPSNTIEG